MPTKRVNEEEKDRNREQTSGNWTGCNTYIFVRLIFM